MPLDYPQVSYPAILDGFVSGNKLRFESLDGSEMTLSYDYSCQILHPAQLGFTGFYQKGEGFRLKNFGPFEQDGKMWGLSNQQKYSHHGFFKTDPDCYHRWLFWRLQAKDDKGAWIPGSEQGIYFRKPFSWRWDVAGTEGKHWVWTKGYLGLRWD